MKSLPGVRIADDGSDAADDDDVDVGEELLEGLLRLKYLWVRLINL